MSAEIASEIAFVDVGPTDHRGLGHAIGEALREPIRAQCERTLALMLRRADRGWLARAAGGIEARSLGAFPQYIEELAAMAAGAAVDFESLLLTNCEESVMNAARERCTTIAFSGEGCVLLGHNEDWAPGWEDSLYVARATLPDGTAFLTLAYLGSLPGSSVAVNSHGVAFSGNSILGTSQPGLPKNLILRSQVEARDLADFERLATRAPRATPNNTMAVDRAGAMVDIETVLDGHAVIHGEGAVLVHTNHVLAEELRHLETVDRPCSASRYATASALSAGAPLSPGLMKDILRSHDGWPRSVCLHAESDDYDDSQTIASAIVDLDELTLAVANGPPCRHDYVTFRLTT